MSDNDDARQITEACFKNKTLAINPIIDWEDEDVWEYIKLRNIPYNPLYDMGYKRVGCIGCPMNVNIAKELEANPKYAQAYKHAFKKYFDARPDLREKWGMKTVDEWYEWWVSGKSASGGTKNITMFDEEDDE